MNLFIIQNAENASTQGRKITEYLDYKLCSGNFPVSSKNLNKIDNDVRKLKNILHQIQSSIIHLTPVSVKKSKDNPTILNFEGTLGSGNSQFHRKFEV